MSWAFIHTMRQYPGQSYVQVLQTTRTQLKQGYEQIPQLSVGLFFVCFYVLRLDSHSADADCMLSHSFRWEVSMI
jgi:hypothetical protein